MNTKAKDAADAEDLGFSGYPIGKASKHYATRVKPALRFVARELGYALGSYQGRGCPSTILHAPEASTISHVSLEWRLNKGRVAVIANVRTKVTRDFHKTGYGQIVRAMSWGIGDAIGYSDPSARTLREAVTSAVRNAEAALAAKE